MSSINKVTVLGNLGADPELKYTPSGAAVCTLRLATNETFTDKGGNKKTRTEWHRVVVWGKQAENCAKFLKKGRAIHVEGRLQTRSWEDKEKVKRYSTEIVAQSVLFLSNGQGKAQAESPSAEFTPSPSDAEMGDVGAEVPVV